MKPLNFMLLLYGAALLLSCERGSVLIESTESKTREGKPVFNEISFDYGKDKDIWLMSQSHDGVHYQRDKWDQIKIVVDKRTTPYSVSYHQLRNNKEIELRASCYTCHSNGPRAIRPEFNTNNVKYSLKDKANIAFMNLRIKTYGKLKMKKTNLMLAGVPRVRPLTYDGPENWEEINLPTCMKCHNEDGFLSRGKLRAQHLGTIAFLTKTKAMPPWPYKLSQAEEVYLQKFLNRL